MKVGDYVRTKNGNIYKIAKLGYNNETFWSDTDEGWFTIYKSSPNIIDLIEEGDYVNGSEVHTIFEPCEYRNEKEILCIGIGGFEGELCFLNEDIKSIVTKEMFANAEYRVETN